MKLELTDQEFRYLLDLVYIGNWVLNSTRGDDRIAGGLRRRGARGERPWRRRRGA